MHGYLIAVSTVAGASVVAILVYLALRIYKRRSESGKDAETKGLCPPSIILTPSSPGQSNKRLYSPTRVRAASKENEEKLAKIRKKEKRKEVKSLWLPKKKDSLPMMTATMVQPTVAEQSKVCKLLANAICKFLKCILFSRARVHAFAPRVSWVATLTSFVSLPVFKKTTAVSHVINFGLFLVICYVRPGSNVELHMC